MILTGPLGKTDYLLYPRRCRVVLDGVLLRLVEVEVCHILKMNRK